MVAMLFVVIKLGLCIPRCLTLETLKKGKSFRKAVGECLYDHHIPPHIITDDKGRPGSDRLPPCD